MIGASETRSSVNYNYFEVLWDMFGSSEAGYGWYLEENNIK